MDSPRDTAAAIAELRAELRSEFRSVTKRLDAIDKRTKSTKRAVDDVADAVSWQALINDAILCAVCLTVSFGSVSIDMIKTEVCPEIPRWGRNIVPFGFCNQPGDNTSNNTAAMVAVNGEAIAQSALAWANKEFNPGVTAQCAYFVRQVLKEAGVTLSPEVTSQPLDNHAPSLGMANSFGADQGEVIRDKSQVQAGDIVLFANTYGNWEAGTITHVGVAVGGGMMVDRPTASKPVQHRSIDTFPNFVGAIRLRGAEGAIAVSGSPGSFDAAMPFVLKWEGGDSDHPNDIGGATRKGITQSSLDAYGRKAGVSTRNPMALTNDEVNAIYKAIWEDSKCGNYADPFALACFDTAVNFGVGGLGEFMQELSVDPATDPKGGAIALADARIAYRHQRVTQRPDQGVFLDGWLNRDNDLKRQIGESVAAIPSTEVLPPAPAPSTALSPEAQTYFQEIAGGSEFGGGGQVRRWAKQEISVAVVGNPTPEDLATLQHVQGELAELTGLRFTQAQGEGDITVHFVPESQFSSIEPNYLPRNMGFFWAGWDDAGNLNKARVLISIEGINQSERSHLIREEFTQVLGLMRDSNKYPDSMFYQGWTTTQAYSELDKQIIRMLYQ